MPIGNPSGAETLLDALGCLRICSHHLVQESLGSGLTVHEPTSLETDLEPAMRVIPEVLPFRWVVLVSDLAMNNDPVR